MNASSLIKAAGRAVAIGAAITLAHTAGAQTYHWVNASGGVWNNTLNWSPTGIPNSSLHDAVIDLPGSYLITLGGLSPTVDLLDISNADATLHVDDAYNLNVNDISNNGSIIVNGAGGVSSTRITFLANAGTLSGSGEIVLNASSGNLDRAFLYYDSSANVLTQGPDHTIRGKGNIYVNVANEGYILADAPNETLQLLGQAKSNSGLMQAIDGAFLQISTVTITQSGGGLIEADNATVDLVNGGRINGGVVRGVNGGSVCVWTGHSGYLGAGTIVEGAFNVLDAGTLYVAGDLRNDGTLTVNPLGGVSSTAIHFAAANSTLSGDGEIVLNAIGGNFQRAFLYFTSSNNVVTQAAEHTIRGKGNIYTRINNLGLVSADQPGEVLQLVSYPKSNSGTMQAINAGVLGISGITITQDPAGLILANNGVVQLYTGGTVSGGTLRSLGSGTFEVPAGNHGVLTGAPCVEGVFNIRVGSVLDFESSVENNATITVNSDAGAAATRLDVNTNLTVSGTGQIVLNAVSDLNRARIYFDSSINVLTNGPLHTIRGRGQIDTRLDNLGLVSADVSGEYLQLYSYPKANFGVMQAVNGGLLQFNTCTLTQDPAGIVRADAGRVQLVGAALISGGLVQSVNGGAIAVPESSHGRLDNFPTLTGRFEVRDAAVLSIDDGIVNNGTIVVNPAGGASATRVDFNSAATSLLGSGEIILNAVGHSDRAYLYFDNSSNVVTQGPDHTIRGRGSIYTRLDNEGTVSADVAGDTLLLRSYPKTNRGLMQAVNNGILQIYGIAVTQDGGHILADGGLVFLSGGGNVINGSIASVNAGVVAVSVGDHGGIAGDATVNARVEVRDAGVLDLSGTLTNEGTIIVNPTGGPSATRITFIDPAQSISGSGQIILNATGGTLDRAYLYYDSSTNVLNQGPGHTIAGEGNIHLQINNAGILSPGHPLASVGEIGRLNLVSRPIVCSASSQVVMQVSGINVGEYDRITGAGAFACAGTLRLEHYGAFTSAPFGTRIPLIQPGSVTGEFDDFIADAMPWPLYWKLVYTSNKVEAVVSCDADFTPDGAIDFFDVQRFLAIFSAGSPESDLNGDGHIDFFDVLMYLNLFSAGC